MEEMVRTQPIDLIIPPHEIEAFLRSAWEYMPEEHETLYGPEFQMFRFRAGLPMLGDCDDAAIMAGAILRAQRAPYRFVAVRPPGSVDFVHVFVETPCYACGETIRIDPTEDRRNDYDRCERMEEYGR